MPLYDYRCDRCGLFTAWNPMGKASAPAGCPVCNDAARRVIAAPFLNTMPAGNRVAHQRNEKSADQPVVVSRAELDRASAATTKRHHACDHSSRPRHPGAERLTGSKSYLRSSKRSLIGH